MSAAAATTVRCDHGQRRPAIVAAVLADVFQGRLRAGQHLVTEQLAQRFGVSHTPIREALITLAGIGIIDLVPNRGAVVRHVTPKDVTEICQVRRALECEAVQSACGRIGLGELDELARGFRRLLAASRKAEPRFIERARELDSQLHDLIASSCDNAFLMGELNRLKLLFRAFRDVAWQRDEARNDYFRLAEESHEHLEIVEALRANDARRAARAMAQHIESGSKYWARSLPETHGEEAVPARRSKPSAQKSDSQEIRS